VAFHLLFGDGSARGVAAMVVFLVVLRNMDGLAPSSDGAEEMIMSLLSISTNFEDHGDGSERAKLVAQAARQNQHAQVLPVNTLEWITMAATFCSISIGNAAKENRNGILTTLEGMLSCYNELPDVAAYTSEPPAKRARRSKGGSAKPDEPEDGHDKGLKIGTRRQIAMRNFLTSGTFSGLQLLRQHLTWVGDYKCCVVSDDLMMKKWFWVGSTRPKADGEDAITQAKTDATQLPPSVVVPRGASHAPLNHESILTAEQFDLMLSKAISIFEGDTAHLDRDDRKAKFKPTEARACGLPCSLELYHARSVS
jgi:hypothetical protein